jgi:hypothetical protein
VDLRGRPPDGNGALGEALNSNSGAGYSFLAFGARSSLSPALEKRRKVFGDPAAIAFDDAS